MPTVKPTSEQIESLLYDLKSDEVFGLYNRAFLMVIYTVNLITEPAVHLVIHKLLTALTDDRPQPSKLYRLVHELSIEWALRNDGQFLYDEPDPTQKAAVDALYWAVMTVLHTMMHEEGAACATLAWAQSKLDERNIL